MNPQTKGVLQNKMKERSGTQMCVKRRKVEEVSFSLKRDGLETRRWQRLQEIHNYL